MMDYSFLEDDSMTLDSEQQRAFLLEMFKQVNFPGHVLEAAYQLQQAIKSAQVSNTATMEDA